MKEPKILDIYVPWNDERLKRIEDALGTIKKITGADIVMIFQGEGKLHFAVRHNKWVVCDITDDLERIAKTE